MAASPVGIVSKLRPRTVGEIIDGAFRIYRRNFRTFLLIVAVVYLPVQILSYAVNVFFLGNYTASGFSGSFSGSIAASNVTSQVTTVKTYLEQFLQYFAQWALTVAVAGAVFGYRVSFGEAYAEVKRRFWAVLGLIGLQTLIALGLFSPALLLVIGLALSGSGASSGLAIALACLGIFPLIYSIIQIRLQVILPAAVNEELTPRQALSRSWELTRNYWWRTFALNFVIGILRSIVTLGPGAVIVAFVGMVIKTDIYTTLAITQVAGILTLAVYMPVEMSAVALYYYDQRVRKEGFDIESAIEEMYERGDEDGDGYAAGEYEQGRPIERSVPLGAEAQSTSDVYNRPSPGEAVT
ncbi:MAG: glycerophosphoryl diester phosphodiesterase membrane domain-containing protein [Chloroflexota bacterium]